MSLVEDLLKKHGATLEDLTRDEMDSFFNILKATEQRQLDLPKVKVYLRDLITALENEYIATDEWDYFFFGLFRRENRKHLFIKARLQNYLVLENLVTSPERAKRAMDEILERIGKKSDIGPIPSVKV